MSYNKKMRKKKVYQECRNFCLEYKKTHPCIKCGESHIACLCFHHRDPSTKEGEVPRLCKYGMKKVLAEIAKCDVLCHNCHSKLHFYEGYINKSQNKQPKKETFQYDIFNTVF